MAKSKDIAFIARALSFIMLGILLTGCLQNSPVTQSVQDSSIEDMSQLQSNNNPITVPDMQLSFIEGTEIPLPKDDTLQWYGCLNSEQVQVAKAYSEAPKNGGISSICIAVSTDKGVRWQKNTLHFDTPVYMLFELGFTSNSEGWISFKPQESNIRFLYKTFDGGKSWDCFSVLNFNYENIRVAFASSLIGWCFAGESELQKNPTIQQTLDGGVTWQNSNLQIPPDMFEGIFDNKHGFRMGEINWNNRWEFSLQPLRSAGYFSSFYYYYTFFWNNEEQAWIWNNPNWKLPENVNPVTFIDYVEGYLYPPITYSPESGLDDFNCATLLYYTKYHLMRINNSEEVAVDTIGYEDINQMAACLYNILDFNSQGIAYLLESYGMVATPEGYIIEDWWQVGKGSAKTKILNAQESEDGTIETVLERTFEDEDTYEKKILYQRCFFQPVLLDGITYFTLLSAEQIEL